MKRISSLILLIAMVVGAVFGVQAMASAYYGPAGDSVPLVRRVIYSARLLWDDVQPAQSVAVASAPVTIEVTTDDSVDALCVKLADAGLIRSSSFFRDYLVYRGLDANILRGSYVFAPGESLDEIARAFADPARSMISFTVLPGWRLEEIAAALPSSGLSIDPKEFLTKAREPREVPQVGEVGTSEGLLLPGSYIVARTTTAEQLISMLMGGFKSLTNDLTIGFVAQGLTNYQAVILASIIQREAMHAEEAPMIASVFINRLQQNMPLGADATVQYALGYDTANATWWKNPLALADLKVDSAFNTYTRLGLPPTPISAPGSQALQAVASPAQSDYLYFSARCDGSGYHLFVRTFEEQLANLCP